MSFGGGVSSSKQTTSGTGTTQQTEGPWPEQAPYLTAGFSRANELLKQAPPVYYPGQTVANMAGGTAMGIRGLNDAAAGSTLPGQASNELTGTVRGNYLRSPGTWADQLFNTYSGQRNPYANNVANVGRNENINAYNPNANIMAGVAANDEANVGNQSANAMNPYASVMSGLATNSDIGAVNPYAGVQNSYLYQPPNAYIDNVSNAIARSVVPQVASRYGAGGRTGDSPIAQASIAKGIADALSPYAFGSAESEMGRRFAGGESEANRLYGAGESYAGRRFAGGESEAQRAQNAMEAQASRIYGAGQEQAGRQFSAGESLAGRQFGAGESYAQALRDAENSRVSGLRASGEALAGRQFAGGADLAARLQQASEAASTRQYQSGENMVGRVSDAREAALGRGQAAYENERQRMQSAAGMAPSLEAARYLGPEAQLKAGATEQDYYQRLLDEQQNRWNFNQGGPDQQLANFMSAIRGDYGGTLSSLSNQVGRASGKGATSTFGSK